MTSEQAGQQGCFARCFSTCSGEQDQPRSKAKSRSSCWSWCSGSQEEAEPVRGGSAGTHSNTQANGNGAVGQSSFANYASQPSSQTFKRRSGRNGSVDLARASNTSSIDLERFHSARSHLSVDSMDLDAQSPSETLRAPSQPPVLEDSEYPPEHGVADSAGSLGSQAGPGFKSAWPAPGSREEWLMKFDQGWLTFLKKVYGGNAQQVADVKLLPPAPWNRKPGYLGYLTDDQTAALAEVRAMFPQSRSCLTDQDLLRWLRGKAFDVEEVKDMLTRYFEEYRPVSMVSPNPPMRPCMNLDGLGLDWAAALMPMRDPAVTTRIRTCLDYFVHAMVFSLDKEGRPVVYLKPANMLKRSMGRYIPIQDRISLQSASNELNRVLCHLASKRAGYLIEDFTQVIDLTGLSPVNLITQARNTESQAEWQHNMDYAPETLCKIFVINAPMGMSTVWKVASNFVPAQTRQKVTMHGRGYQAELAELIGVENLPSCYGGTYKYDWPEHKDLKELEP
ncbi:hypothetical protein WJX84_002546 [Apatococcus fuscideae]|uniref:CRAL-TRIO domain-containing protein n=1 Tax=Apatococcus fuscideae TaxID=2026836 RepID=A0AAW1TF81_9CHLO